MVWEIRSRCWPMPIRRTVKMKNNGEMDSGWFGLTSRTGKLLLSVGLVFADVDQGDQAQFAGWPITFDYRNNDGRKPIGYLPEMVVKGVERPVVQVIEDATGEILYTVRMDSNRFRPPVYSKGNYTVKMGREKPDLSKISGLKPVQPGVAMQSFKLI